MPDRRPLAALALLGLPAAPGLAQSGGGYEITAWTVSGGAVHNASGGPFTLSGTVGQHDAGDPMAGANFTVHTGFWPAAIVQDACPADLVAPFGQIDLFDLLAFLDAYNSASPIADFAAPFGQIDVFDLLTFVDLYTMGCP